MGGVGADGGGSGGGGGGGGRGFATSLGLGAAAIDEGSDAGAAEEAEAAAALAARLEALRPGGAAAEGAAACGLPVSDAAQLLRLVDEACAAVARAKGDVEESAAAEAGERCAQQ